VPGVKFAVAAYKPAQAEWLREKIAGGGLPMEVHVGRTAEHGISPLEDQRIAGALMMSVDLAIILFAVGFFFYRSGQDHDRAEAAQAEAYGSTSPRRIA